MDDLVSLLTGANAALVGAIVAILSTLKALFPNLFTKPAMLRLLPIMPIFLAIGAVFVGCGEAGSADSGWQNKLVLGCLVGFTAGQLYKAGKTSIFGWGIGKTEPADLSPVPALPPDVPTVDPIVPNPSAARLAKLDAESPVTITSPPATPVEAVLALETTVVKAKNKAEKETLAKASAKKTRQKKAKEDAKPKAKAAKRAPKKSNKRNS